MNEKLGIEDKDVEIKKLLEKYFKEVYDFSLSLDTVVFPDATVSGRMVCPKQLTEDRIVDAFVKKFRIKIYQYEKPVTQKIRNTQSRPDGLYPFVYDMCDEPDAQHLGKSYDDAMSAGFPFANTKEYLLMTGFHRFTKGYFMDKKGWTRTSSLYSGGVLVSGIWGGDHSNLWLGYGNVDGRYSDDGPRQLFL